VRVPKEAKVGEVQITLSLPDWKEALPAPAKMKETAMLVTLLALILGTMILWVVPAQAVDLTKIPCVIAKEPAYRATAAPTC